MSQLAAAPLIARHAESTIWLARYMERIENLARLLDVTKTFAHDDSSWLSILRINGDEAAFSTQNVRAGHMAVARFYLLDSGNPTSVVAAIAQARENARTLRALISVEMWLHLNVFHAHICALTEADIAPERLSLVCAMLKEGAQTHNGITEGTFYRDQAWHFYMIGRHLERADQTTRLLDTRFNELAPSAGSDEGDAGQWDALLRAVTGYHAYRRDHPHGYRPEEIVRFLLANTAFPRSVGLNLAQLEWHLTQLRVRHRLRGGAKALERVDHLCSLLTQQSCADLLKQGLSPFLDWVQREIAALHDDLVRAFCGAR
ncbi:MAG: alpha-E domain-containing protein [Acetobacteraceae bacterium]|nr:alpha-E domain-containing protein [Acetobacteraceae bacterium]